MTLPILNKRTYGVFLPCSKQNVSFRGFSVGEEKLILIFQEETKNEPQDLSTLIKQIISNCTFEKVNTDELPLTDLEILFLEIRKVSVGSDVELLPICKACGETTKIKYSINDIQLITHENHTNVVELDSEQKIGVVFKYPTLPMINLISKESQFVQILIECTESVWQGEEVHLKKDLPVKELEDFYLSMTKEHVEKIHTQFLKTIPKSEMKINWDCKHCSEKNEIVLDGFIELFR